MRSLLLEVYDDTYSTLDDSVHGSSNDDDAFAQDDSPFGPGGVNQLDPKRKLQPLPQLTPEVDQGFVGLDPPLG